MLLKSLALLAPVVAASSLASTALAQDVSAGALAGVASVISPEAKGALTAAVPLTDADREAMIKRRDAIRDATSSRGGGPASGVDRTSPATPEAAESEANKIGRNFRNTRATVVSSTLAEPSAANDAAEVLGGGNTYFSRSTNHGATWVADTIPGGPADAPFACCDLDAVHKGSLDTTFATVLYTNSAQTNGVVRIFVRRSTIAGGNDCTYLIDPAGTSNNILPDYPHTAVSNNFVYLTMNLLRGGSWIGAQIKRFNASQMANCQIVATTTLTYVGTDGQRILTPVENASTTMYFGLNRSANVFRIVRLPESTSSLSLFDRTLSLGSNFVNPDCRGGVGNFDFIERSTSWSIAGFRLRGAVVPGNRLWFLWNAGPDATHTQAHLNSAIFTEPGLSLLSSPPVFNNGECFGYPALGANAFGEFGLTFAHGGKAGGSGTAAQGAIAVDDAGSAGNFFPFYSTTASGTHNRSDSRYGDYFTIRRNDACTYAWVATNYALLNGNTSSANVNARYVEFQSSLRAACP